MYDWSANFLTDLTRAILVSAWIFAAYRFAFAARKSHVCQEPRPLLWFGFATALYNVLFQTAFTVASHAGWSTSWHNEASRLGTYLVVSLLITWVLILRKRCIIRERNGER